MTGDAVSTRGDAGKDGAARERGEAAPDGPPPGLSTLAWTAFRSLAHAGSLAGAGQAADAAGMSDAARIGDDAGAKGAANVVRAGDIGRPGAAGGVADATYLRGEAGREGAGTRVRFELAVRDGRVVAARFRAYGCPHTLAACEWLAGRLGGMSVSDISLENPIDWADKLEVPEYKLGRLLLVEDALRAALRLPPKSA